VRRFRRRLHLRIRNPIPNCRLHILIIKPKGRKRARKGSRGDQRILKNIRD
jgi:hypothetical protein